MIILKLNSQKHLLGFIIGITSLIILKKIKKNILRHVSHKGGTTPPKILGSISEILRVFFHFASCITKE